MKHGVDLYTVLHMTDIFDKDRELVYMRRDDDMPTNRPTIIATVSAVKKQYDLRKTKVVHITPYFQCGDYEGLLFTVTEKGSSANGR